MKFKKPKFWDYKKPNILSYILLPLSFLIKIFNFIKIKDKKKFSQIKTICIGNIYLGGTGKTSLCLKLNEIINRYNKRSCFIKKYYPDQIDEHQILRNNGELFLNNNRIEAINKAIENKYNFAIFDDGLQDKSIHYDIVFICFNIKNWIGNGLTIPAGPLRQDLDDIKNYQNIFLIGNNENTDNIKNEIFKINPNINIYNANYVPVNIENFSKDLNYLVFSGIGNHDTFVSMLKNYKINILKDIEFPDHYKYSNKDIDKINELSNNLNCKILTTEKDYLRLNENHKININFIKSDLKILDENKLINYILK